MQQTVYEHDRSLDLPTIRQVKLSEPLKWLTAGWRDFKHAPIASGFYGLMFVLLSYAVTAATWQTPILVLTFITGFFLISPFLALGLYHLSHQREQGETVRLAPSLFAFRKNRFDMGLLIAFYAVVMVAWIRLVTLMNALYFSNAGVSIDSLPQQLFSTGEGAGIVALFVLSGGLLALLIFVTGAISWPMLLDRSSGVINAVATSIAVVKKNKSVMLIWAMLIVALLTLGIATFYLGLLIIMPVLGHATWHAYRSLVGK